MPVDDRNDAPHEGRPPEGDEPLAAAAEPVAEPEAENPEPTTPQARRRRWVNRRNAVILTISLAVIAVGLILIALLAYRMGYVDRYIAQQIKTTFAQYGIRAEIKEFHTSGARNVVMNDVELYDATTNERLGRIEKLTAVIRIEDLYALNLRRNINLEKLTIDGVEVWVRFDAEGNSNFRNIKLPPPDPNTGFSSLTRRPRFRLITASFTTATSGMIFRAKRATLWRRFSRTTRTLRQKAG